MNLTFSQSAGTITDDQGTVLTHLAFAGNDSRPDVNPNHIHGFNNPGAQNVRCIGPLPQGVYRCGAWGTYPKVGQIACPLTQTSGETFGRSGFFIHGPGALDPLNSSEGCIVVPHDDRIKVMGAKPSTIAVTA